MTTQNGHLGALLVTTVAHHTKKKQLAIIMACTRHECPRLADVEAIAQKHAGTYFGEAFEGNKVNVIPFCQGEPGKPCYYLCHNFQKKAIEKKGRGRRLSLL